MRPFAPFAALLVLTLAAPTSAHARPAAGEQRAVGRIAERDVRNLVTRIEKSTDRFRRSIDRSLDDSRLDGTRREDQINDLVKDLENAADRLEDRVHDERAAAATAREVLKRGALIDAIMRRGQFGARAERDWRALRADLDRLARLYRIAWAWDAPDRRRDRR